MSLSSINTQISSSNDNSPTIVSSQPLPAEEIQTYEIGNTLWCVIDEHDKNVEGLFEKNQDGQLFTPLLNRTYHLEPAAETFAPYTISRHTSVREYLSRPDRKIHRPHAQENKEYAAQQGSALSSLSEQFDFSGAASKLAALKSDVKHLESEVRDIKDSKEKKRDIMLYNVYQQIQGIKDFFQNPQDLLFQRPDQTFSSSLNLPGPISQNINDNSQSINPNPPPQVAQPQNPLPQAVQSQNPANNLNTASSSSSKPKISSTTTTNLAPQAASVPPEQPQGQPDSPKKDFYKISEQGYKILEFAMFDDNEIETILGQMSEFVVPVDKKFYFPSAKGVAKHLWGTPNLEFAQAMNEKTKTTEIRLKDSTLTEAKGNNALFLMHITAEGPNLTARAEICKKICQFAMWMGVDVKKLVYQP